MGIKNIEVKEVNAHPPKMPLLDSWFFIKLKKENVNANLSVSAKFSKQTSL